MLYNCHVRPSQMMRISVSHRLILLLIDIGGKNK
uniref:Uncharacterized protein n=1 Tax=Arundo donax TaxID=35708 RepID=A0A0A9AXU7_ARUDO